MPYNEWGMFLHALCCKAAKRGGKTMKRHRALVLPKNEGAGLSGVDMIKYKYNINTRKESFGTGFLLSCWIIVAGSEEHLF